MRNLFAILLTLLGLTVCGRATTLADYARHNPLTVQTIQRGSPVDLGPGNQVNNLQNGGKVLVLSSKGLTSLDGISGLTVLDDGRPTPITQVDQLQLFLNDNEISTLPDEF